MGQWTRLKRSTQRGSNGCIWHWLSRGLPGSGRGATVGRSPAPVLGFIPQVRKYHMEYIDRRRYAEASQQRHTAAITTSVFVLSDDDLVVTGLTTKSLRDLFEAALLARVRSADQQEAIELAGIVLDRLEQSGIRHRDIARGVPQTTSARYTPDQAAPRASSSSPQAVVPARLDLVS